MFDDEEYEGYDREDVNFTFELINSEDGKIVTLVCTADKELKPDEYACALKDLAKQIEVLVSMGDDTSHTLN